MRFDLDLVPADTKPSAVWKFLSAFALKRYRVRRRSKIFSAAQTGLAAGRKWIIKPCMGLFESDATLTTFDLGRVEVILSAPIRFI